MPLSVGDGDLQIVVSKDISPLGPKDGSLTSPWRWYYHFPMLPLWGLVLLLLVGPKANRNRQVWLVLIPLALVLLVWRMPARLLSSPEELTESLGFFVTTGAMAWTVVWLLGHQLAFGNRIVSSMAIIVVAMPVGVLAWFGHAGRFDLDAIPRMVTFGVLVVISLATMAFSARICCKRFSPGRFCSWLLLGDCVLVSACLLVLIMPAFFLDGGKVEVVLQFAMIDAIAGLVIGIVIFLINLPFLILAFKSPFYWDRFEKLFGVARAHAAEPELAAAAVDAVIVEDLGEEKEPGEQESPFAPRT